MRIGKIIYTVAIAALAVKSFDIDIPYVKQEALAVSKQETVDTKRALQSVQENYVRQNRDLAMILEALAELSCQTASLQLNVENGNRQMSMAEKIDGNLDSIRDRIDRLEKEAERARKLDADAALSAQTIRRLRMTVENQQKEIDMLRATVSDREATIRTQSTVIAVQKDTISEQMRTILRQKVDLERSLYRQTEMVFQAGCEFERLGDEGDQLLNVSGKKDKEKVRMYKKAIYEKAGQCFRQAADMEHSGAANRREAIEYKIASL